MAELKTPIATASRPSEAGHWYTLDGRPMYTIIGANGKERDTTLRDARKLDLVPSVTTVINAAAKPGLDRWKQEQVLHAALTLPPIPGESEKSYLDRIWEDSRAQTVKAAEKGTKIHAGIQGHYEGRVPDQELWPFVKGAINAVREWEPAANVPAPMWRVETSFASNLGYGGKADLNASTDAGGVLLDFKSKEFTAKSDVPRLWDEHYMQLGAYRFGLNLRQARAGICFVSTIQPGYSVIVECTEEQLMRGWVMFYHLLRYWQAAKDHYPTKGPTLEKTAP